MRKYRSVREDFSFAARRAALAVTVTLAVPSLPVKCCHPDSELLNPADSCAFPSPGSGPYQQVYRFPSDSRYFGFQSGSPVHFYG